MERDWVFGNVVCIYCHWLFCFVFETVREEVVYLSGVSVSHVGYLNKSFVFVWKRSGISGTWLLLWSLCSGVLSLYLYVAFALLSPARAMHSSDCHHGNELRQCQQRLIIVESYLWPQVVCRLVSRIFRCGIIVSAVMIATCVRAFCFCSKISLLFHGRIVIFNVVNGTVWAPIRGGAAETRLTDTL